MAVILKRFDQPDEVREFPLGHDSWVVGDKPYVSLHFMGAEDYVAHD